MNIIKFFTNLFSKKFISKADSYFIETLKEIKRTGQWDKNPRPKYKDGTKAHSKFITQKSFEYRIDKGEFPVISLRPTAIKGAFYDIEAIYQSKTNKIGMMHPSIQEWWRPFTTSPGCIGKTYGYIVKKYYLVDKLLDGMMDNPFGRRHIMNLWQENEFQEDYRALVPCAYETLYSITEINGVHYVDMTLNQRSQDFIVTASINSIQYVMLGLMICSHLEFYTGVKHILRKFKHNVQNIHIYDRHFFAVDILLNREPSSERFNMSLKKISKFSDIRFEDFDIKGFSSIAPLPKPLEIAV